MWRRVLAVVLVIIVVFGFTYIRNGQEKEPEQSWGGDTMTAMTLEEIWNIDNKVNFVVEMGFYLGEKCGWGGNMSVLTEEERVIYIVRVLDGEVHNGGFVQYFWNSSGNQANELVDAFTEIGAPQTAAICEKALSVFGGHVPDDWDERNDVLDALCEDDESVGEILSECDDAFYDYEENLTDLCYQYIMNNKDQFR